MAAFYNQATLLYGGRAVNSNVTVGEIVGAVGMTKSAVSTDYGAGDTVTYAIGITNGGGTDLTGLSLTDDLGAYAVGGTTVVPLEYIPGTLRYYVNGALTEGAVATAGPPLTVSGINLPAGGNAILIYETRVGGFAPLASGSVITNTATLGGTGLLEPVTDTATVAVNEGPVLSITKSLEPGTVSGNGQITYTFVIQNTGNTAAVATDDVTVTDTFNPVLTDITVTIDGATVTEGVGYSYDVTTGEFATLPGALPIPAATFTQDPVTGVITTTPGVTVLTVSGRI